VEASGHQSRQEVRYNIRCNPIDCLPDLVRGIVRARCRGWRGPGQCRGDLSFGLLKGVLTGEGDDLSGRRCLAPQVVLNGFVQLIWGRGILRPGKHSGGHPVMNFFAIQTV